MLNLQEEIEDMKAGILRNGTQTIEEWIEEEKDPKIRQYVRYIYCLAKKEIEEQINKI